MPTDGRSMFGRHICVSKPVNTDQASARLDAALKLAIVFDATGGGGKIGSRNSPCDQLFTLLILWQESYTTFLSTNILGRKLILPSWDNNTVSICYSGLLSVGDADLTRYLLRRIRKDEVFYDIGANYGFYTALASGIATDGQVHAFEPGALCSAYLERNFAGNRNVIFQKVAVSDSAGHIAFYDASASGGSVASSVFRAAFEGTAIAYKKVDVRATTLDAYLEKTSANAPEDRCRGK